MTMPAEPTESTDLVIDSLEVEVSVGQRRMLAVRGASLSVGPGEIVGLIGESGSGKTLTLRAALGLLPPGCRVVGGDLRWRGEDLRAASQHRWRELHRSQLVYVPADSASLNPVYRLEAQLAESVDADPRSAKSRSRRRLRDTILESLAAVGLGRTRAETVAIARRYPHQLSGGMRQRSLIAMAVERRGAVLVADEPTSGLDMTTQRQVMRLLRDLRDTTGLGMLVTSHDLDLVGDIADRVVVMYGGQVVEHGARAEVFDDPRHPYTVSLLECVPSRAAGTERLRTIDGAPPRLDELQAGCAFLPRCPRHRELGSPADCLTDPADTSHDESGRSVRCWFSGSGAQQMVRS